MRIHTTTLSIILTLAFIISGCSESSTSPVIECTSPLILHGDSCCMDADKDGTCDIDQKEEAGAQESVDVSVSITEDTVNEERPAREQTSSDASPEVKKSAEAAGKLFADTWNKRQYSLMHTMLVKNLRERRSADQFTAIMELDPFYKKIDSVEFGGIVMLDEDRAELKLTAHTNVQEIAIPGAELKYELGAWKVSIFADVFELEPFDAACSGYRYDKQFTTEDCASEFAKKTKDPNYCEISQCHYVECLDALGQPAGMKQEAEQCRMCPPVMKTVNECVLDVAIKYDKISACDVISEGSYNDKYCVCYGGFAKHGNNGALCNAIADEEYKDLCLKGFRGEMC